jgi:hypothetical protein
LRHARYTWLTLSDPEFIPLNSGDRWPALGGGLLALLAAGLFGISTPLVQRFGAGIGSFTTAALLYMGASSIGVFCAGPSN